MTGEAYELKAKQKRRFIKNYILKDVDIFRRNMEAFVAMMRWNVYEDAFVKA